MNIHLHTLVWNEEKILPYVLRHYSKFCEKMFFWDNESTDASVEIIKSYPNTEVITYNSGNQFNDLINAHVKNNAWKKSKKDADWVIVNDCDEFVHHPDLINFLADCKKKGYTILIPYWCEMISDSFPPPNCDILDYVQYGYRIPDGKPAIFDPSQIQEINYGVGAHKAYPTGDVVWHRANELQCYHMKHLGMDYVMERKAAYRDRMSDINLAMGWGWHYQQDYAQSLNYFNECKQKAVKVYEKIS